LSGWLGFPLFHGLPGTLLRAYSGKRALALLLAPLLTAALIALGVDQRVRDFFVRHVPLGGGWVRFSQLSVGMVWPIAFSYVLVRRGYYRRDRESLAAGFAILQAMLLVAALVFALKFATGRPQPESGEPSTRFYGFSLDNGRTVHVMWPSGHTAQSFGAAAALVAFWPERRRLGRIAYALAAIVSGTMLVSTFHWSSDIFAAMLLATPIGWSTGESFRRWIGAMERFRLTKDVQLVLELGDITKTRADAIVNAANEAMLGGGGVDGAIHRAAGPELLAACRKEPEVSPGVRCPTGEARITPGFALPAKHVIHTVGPIYGEDEDAAALLSSAYRSSLEVAKASGLRSIAFPAISCGVFAYPLDEAAGIALETCRAHAGPPLEEVRFVLFSADVYAAWLEAAKKLS